MRASRLFVCVLLLHLLLLGAVFYKTDASAQPLPIAHPTQTTVSSMRATLQAAATARAKVDPSTASKTPRATKQPVMPAKTAHHTKSNAPKRQTKPQRHNNTQQALAASQPRMAPQPAALPTINSGAATSQRSMDTDVNPITKNPGTSGTPTRASTPVTLSQQAAIQGFNQIPVYPRQSRRRQEQGTVWLELQLNAQGLVAQLRVKRSSGFARLDEAALTAVRRWRFQHKGLTEAKSNDAHNDHVWYQLPIKFSLQHKEPQASLPATDTI